MIIVDASETKPEGSTISKVMWHLTDEERKILEGRTPEEVLFWRLDDIVYATAPDTPKGVVDEWDFLYNKMSEDFLKVYQEYSTRR